MRAWALLSFLSCPTLVLVSPMPTPCFHTHTRRAVLRRPLGVMRAGTSVLVEAYDRKDDCILVWVEEEVTV